MNMLEKIKSQLCSTFRSLKYKNYLLFFIGQCISLVGTWIQQIAISWLVYKLTNSALLMGVITFIGAIPSLLLSPFAGALIDRVDKYKALIAVQSIFMLEALFLAVLTLSGNIRIEYIIIISAFVGMTSAIDMPLRQSFVIKLVEDDKDLGNAISLNSSMFNMSRIIGPAIAGVLIAAVGEGYCFLINAISYIAVICALFAMKINTESGSAVQRKNIFREILDGVQYSWRVKSIRNALLYLSVSSFIGMGYQILMPIFAKESLHGNAQTLGFLMSVSGLGALVGALRLASKKTHQGLDRTIFIASIILGCALVGLKYTSFLFPAMVLLMFNGYGMVTIMASSNTIIQHYVEEEKRGRVMSLYTMAFVGTIPLGSLFEGAVANRLGVQNTFLFNGIIIIFCALLFDSVFNNKMSEV